MYGGEVNLILVNKKINDFNNIGFAKPKCFGFDTKNVL